jgi:hypothetical protein
MPESVAVGLAVAAGVRVAVAVASDVEGIGVSVWVIGNPVGEMSGVRVVMSVRLGEGETVVTAGNCEV